MGEGLVGETDIHQLTVIHAGLLLDSFIVELLVQITLGPPAIHEGYVACPQLWWRRRWVGGGWGGEGRGYVAKWNTVRVVQGSKRSKVAMYGLCDVGIGARSSQLNRAMHVREGRGGGGEQTK